MILKSIFLYLFLITIFLIRLYFICLNSCQPESTKNTFFSDYKSKTVKQVRSHLPSPHSELLLGMTIGLDEFNDVPIFKQNLKDTGTIHVVVVSGFNISLVYNLILSILGSIYSRKNFLIALFITLFYSVLSGFEPPVIRSWIMGSIISFAKFSGRKVPIISVLLFSAILMLVVNPLFIFSISFHLSFLATLSLVLFSEPMAIFISQSKNILVQDLLATLSAQVLVLPYISYVFGTVSVLSPIVNALVLWTVPLATVFGGVYLLVSLISTKLAYLISVVIYMPLDFFTLVVDLFSKISFISMPYKMPIQFLIFYYLVVAVFYYVFKKRFS